MSQNKEDIKNKIIYRSSYRGTKEMDILMTSFVKSIINELDYKKNANIKSNSFIVDNIASSYNTDKLFKVLENLKFSNNCKSRIILNPSSSIKTTQEKLSGQFKLICTPKELKTNVAVPFAGYFASPLPEDQYIDELNSKNIPEELIRKNISSENKIVDPTKGIYFNHQTASEYLPPRTLSSLNRPLFS